MVDGARTTTQTSTGSLFLSDALTSIAHVLQRGLWFLFSCSLIGTLALPADAQYFGRNKVQYEDFQFDVLNSEQFRIYFYPREDTAARDAARMAERWYARHARTFEHTFGEKKPLIFYANKADFQQTNIIRGRVSQATGGVTEPLKERVVMPFTPNYGETNHVLGHELVHSFQFDVAGALSDTSNFSLQNHPTWLIEGMAEYLSVGRHDTHTAMWMRDAALNDDLPKLSELSSGQYFPYRFGAAYMAYIGGQYGDRAVTEIFKRAGYVPVDSAITVVTKTEPDTISSQWIDSIQENYLPPTTDRTSPDSVGSPLVEEGSSTMDIAPVLSPDGDKVAFISRRNVFTSEIFVANTETGKIVDNIGSIPNNPHLDAIRFLSSAGSWSPDGDRFAFVAFAEGDNTVTIWDSESGDIEETIHLDQLPSITNVAWSPEGDRMAISGMESGVSDLFLLDVETREVRQLTDGRYAEMQPSWGPEGDRIAFTTDRGIGGSNFEKMRFAPMRIGIIDVSTRSIDVVRPFEEAVHHNPAFSPDGNSVFFISDQDGFKDIYRHDLTTGTTYRVTHLKTGVSGVTTLSPAMSVAGKNGRMAFSVFSDREYELRGLPASATAGEPVDQPEATAGAGILPPPAPENESLVSAYLTDYESNLPPVTAEFPTQDAASDFSLTRIAPPRLGVGVGGAYGTNIQGGIGFYFSDMFSEHNLMLQVQAQGRVSDIGGQVAYLNKANRVNWGASVGHIPRIRSSASVGIDPTTGQRVVQQLVQRIFIDQGQVTGAYPFSSTRRLEANVGVTRYGFDYERITYVGGRRNRSEIPNRLDPDPIYLADANLAYVTDYSFFGYTSPMMGARYRLGVMPRTGTDTYVTALADYRRYFFLNPVTLAFQGLHVGNYGTSGEQLFSQEYLGQSYYPGFVRGYGFGTFSSEECPVQGSACSALSRLTGTRIVKASAELRLPLLGSEQFGLMEFRYLPTELTLFADGGVAWTADSPPEFDIASDAAGRVPVFSAGVSTRFNLMGRAVFEIYWAYPFQRPAKQGGIWGFQLQPGW